MTQDLSVPTVILSVDPVKDKSVVNYDGTKILLSLTIVKGLPILSDLVQKCLPLINIITQFLVDFL